MAKGLDPPARPQVFLEAAQATAGRAVGKELEELALEPGPEY
jgi:hypothetical protein